ncbi:exosome component Rrp46 [Thamnocephalis sphaerospora]|uniref:Exosome component Rrp46 n=1 Tax=Thamnocephalis sphaerospora TaxID=78915 RepID=A0A4P9XXT3_9FUNG|nr:exosome component Rrp46 [Thamnocephalis sphaerospora]|eukprot:RKP11206.1 exosome component Rrp46 [Thamnocephalis sphaerospora]
MPRKDGRTTTQMRAMSATQGALERADGSVRFGFGDTQTMCAVNGPVEARLREEQLDRATVEAVYRPIIGLPGVRAKEIEAAVQTVAEASLLAGLHPRTLVQVTAQCMSDAGSSVAATLNATAMALMDAGLPLRAVPAAVACAISPEGEVLVDPTAEEEQCARSQHVFAFDNTSQEMVFCASTGKFTAEELAACHDLCRAGAAKVHAFYRVALERKLAEEGIVA